MVYMFRYIVVFLVVFLVLFSLQLTEPVIAHVVEPFTSFIATVTTWIIVPFDHSVITYGRVIQDSVSGLSISIESGCNGVEATIVLIAAVIAFPASWRQRLVVIVLGFLAIQVANLARIISLFYLMQWNQDVFNWIHLYLWPILIMLDVLFVFMVFVRYISARTTSGEVLT
jgi:exosortase H (IPTLxxWG-CTERM-specific)